MNAGQQQQQQQSEEDRNNTEELCNNLWGLLLLKNAFVCSRSDRVVGTRAGNDLEKIFYPWSCLWKAGATAAGEKKQEESCTLFSLLSLFLCLKTRPINSVPEAGVCAPEKQYLLCIFFLSCSCISYRLWQKQVTNLHTNMCMFMCVCVQMLRRLSLPLLSLPSRRRRSLRTWIIHLSLSHSLKSDS